MRNYHPEPWLDSDLAQEFILSQEEILLGKARLKEAPDAPSREIPVFDPKGRVLRYEAIGGALSFVKSLIAVEALIPQESDLHSWRKRLSGLFTQLREEGIRLDKSYRLVWCNAGHHHLKASRTGEMMAQIFILFAEDVVNPLQADRNVGRYGPLAQHLKPGVSKHLGRFKVGMGKDEVLRNWYCSWDSFYFIRKSSIGHVDSNILKIFGNEDIAGLALAMANGTPTPVFKGVGVVVPDKFWAGILHHAGLDESLDIDILAANRKDVKFVDDREVIEADFWMVMPTIHGKKARITSDERQLDSLLPEAKVLLDRTRVEAAREIKRAFVSLSEGNPRHLISMVNSAIEEMSGCNTDDLSVEEQEALNVLFNSAGRVVSALELGLPIMESEIVGLIEPLIVTRIKGINVPGITRFSMPSNLVSEFGCALSAFDMERLGLEVGDSVTDIRYPNLGSSMISTVIELAHGLDAVIGHPETGKKYQSEDYDGDLSIVVPMPLIDNEKIVVYTGKHEEEVEGGAPSAASIFVSSSFGKLNVGKTDGCITRLLSHGRTDLLGYVYDTLQALVDMAKKNIQVSLDVHSLLKDENVGMTPSSLQVLKARVSTGIFGCNGKDYTAMGYALSLARGWVEKPHQLSGCLDFIKELPLIVSRRNSVYTSMTWKAFARDISRDEKYGEGRLLESWERLLDIAAPDFLFSYQREGKTGSQRFYESRAFPVQFSNSLAKKIVASLVTIKRIMPQAVVLAHDIYEEYLRYWEALKDESEDAYGILRELRLSLWELASSHSLMVGYAMKYLALSVMGASSEIVVSYASRQALELGRKGITMKSTSILASLPSVIGNYNLRRLIKASGYRHDFSAIRVVSRDEFLSRFQNRK